MSRRALTQPGFRIRAADKERPSRRHSSRSALGPALVVNADLPSLAVDDLLALEAATPEPGIAIAPAADGTTNALGLSDTTLFAPLYGRESAARFRAHAERSGVAAVDIIRPGLRNDVDTVADLVNA